MIYLSSRLGDGDRTLRAETLDADVGSLWIPIHGYSWSRPYEPLSEVVIGSLWLSADLDLPMSLARVRRIYPNFKSQPFFQYFDRRQQLHRELRLAKRPFFQITAGRRYR